MFSGTAPGQCIALACSRASNFELYGFCTSLIRNLMGTGSLLAFPGSMIGALVCGMLYRSTGKLAPAYAGRLWAQESLAEVLCYPVTNPGNGQGGSHICLCDAVHMSTLCGTVIAAFLIGVLCKSGAFKYMKQLLDANVQPSVAVKRQGK